MANPEVGVANPGFGVANPEVGVTSPDALTARRPPRLSVRRRTHCVSRPTSNSVTAAAWRTSSVTGALERESLKRQICVAKVRNSRRMPGCSTARSSGVPAALQGDVNAKQLLLSSPCKAHDLVPELRTLKAPVWSKGMQQPCFAQLPNPRVPLACPTGLVLTLVCVKLNTTGHGTEWLGHAPIILKMVTSAICCHIPLPIG